MVEPIGQKVGIMGGTFDPIHMGHLIIAENAREKYHLDKVLIMPNKNPAYKDKEKITDAVHRIHMAELCVLQNEYFRLSTIEMNRQGYTYTYETLEELKREHPENSYYFILGADSLFSFERWKYPERICSNCILLLANRYQSQDAKLDKQIKVLEQRFGAVIYKLDCPNIDLSSEMIRNRVRNRHSIRYYVTPEVENYIQRQGLYCQEDKNAEK